MSGAAPVTSRWTPAQQLAIDSRDAFVVVSAAAGSGKTSVLTERVLNLIAPAPDAGEAVALDSLLIVTFTRKAARQMRDRIERRLVGALREAPEDAALGAALDALPGAWITTIDSFCLRVVEEYFHRAGLNPPVRAIEPAEERELRRESIERTLEEWGGDPKRRGRLGDLMQAAGGSPEKLSDAIAGLMGFMDSLDGGEQWLERARREGAATGEAAALAQLPFFGAMGEAFTASGAMLAESFEAIVEQARGLGAEPERLEQWTALAEELKKKIVPQALVSPETLDAWFTENADYTLCNFDKKYACGAVLFGDKDFVKHTLKPFAGRWKKWRERWTGATEELWLRGAKLAADALETLAALTLDARAGFTAAKRRRGLISFSDMQQLTWTVLTDPNSPDRPSEAAVDLRRRFTHVLIDEYQDTSPLQDAIARRVSGLDDPEPGARASLFIVGDLKQSIYRFRHAAPDLFQAKLDAARAAIPGAPASDPTPRAIHLDRNFRSRAGVIAFANACFERLMDPQLGGIDYNANHRLVHARETAEGADPVGVEFAVLSKTPEMGKTFEDDGDESPEGVEAQAAWVAARIRAMTGDDPAIIADPDTGELRPARPGDCAILLRANTHLETWIQALERAGIQALTPGFSPLFTAPELIDLMNALRIADNPFQDIPLAGLMRSPLGGFDDEDLLRIRMARPARGAPFHEALWTAAGLPDALPPHENDPEGQAPPGELRERLAAFVERIRRWGDWAQRLGPGETFERILAETQYEAWLLGRPGAPERLANLDFLRELIGRLGGGRPGANPLSVFLDRVESAFQRGDEVGEMPEPVEENGEAVHLMTVHKSKGLEFPAVFLPMLERGLRHHDAAPIRFDRRLGMAAPGLDAGEGVKYPSPLLTLLDERHALDERAEELRLFYVAMTRARERLVLCAQVKDPEAQWEKWRAAGANGAAWGALARLYAASFAELAGPVAALLAETPENAGWLNVTINPPLMTPGAARPGDEALRAAFAREGADPARDWETVRRELAAQSAKEIPSPAPVLPPEYDAAAALVALPAKIPVTQWKKRAAAPMRDPFAGGGAPDPESADELARYEEPEMLPAHARSDTGGLRRPAWAREGAAASNPTAAARGTLTHEFFARIDLRGALDAEGLRAQARAMLGSGSLVLPGFSVEAAMAALDFGAIEWYFGTGAGRLMATEPGRVMRELPFTARRYPGDLAGVTPAQAAAFPGETILLHGVIDVLIDGGEKTVIIDYKTGRIRDAAHLDDLCEQYAVQLRQYAKSITAIWGVRKVETWLAFLDARRLIQI